MTTEREKEQWALIVARAYIGGLVQVLSDRFIGHNEELSALATLWKRADEALHAPETVNLSEDSLWWLRVELRAILKHEPTEADLREGARRLIEVMGKTSA